MQKRRLSNVIGFDDAPFERADRGEVGLIGAVCAGTRLDIVLRTSVKRDGDDATDAMVKLVRLGALEHVRAVLLQGITVGGFNVVDLERLHRETGLPVLVVMRRRPRFEKVFRALEKLPGAAARRQLIEAAGEPEKLGEVYVQRAGLSVEESARLLERTTLWGKIPEPLRLAHLIAGGITTGLSRGRA